MNIHLSRISSLQLIVNAIKFPPQSVFRCSIKYLCPDAGFVGRPGNEEDLALLTVVHSHIVEIKHCISAVVIGKGCCEILVTFCGPPSLINQHFLGFLVDLEHNVTMRLLPLQLLKQTQAFVGYPHACCCQNTTTISTQLMTCIALHLWDHLYLNTMKFL